MGMGGGGDVEKIDTDFIHEAKAESLRFLDQALRNAIPYSEYFLQKALDEQRRQFELARADTKEYYERSQAQAAPYREAGFQALDQLQDTLGMSRLSSGSSALYHAMENKAKEDAARKQMQMAASQFATRMKMDPKDAMRFINSATYGNNFPGLMQALDQYKAQGFRPEPPKLEASQLTPFGEHGDKLNPNNDYGNLLQDTAERFYTDPYSEFTAAALPLSEDVRRAYNLMSSKQRNLATLGQTGYSHLTPTVMDIK